MGLNTSWYVSYLTYLIIAGLSLHLTVFIDFEEHWMCFCAGDTSKYMMTFTHNALRLLLISVAVATAELSLDTSETILSPWQQQSCHSIHQKQSCRRGNSRAVTRYIRNNHVAVATAELSLDTSETILSPWQQQSCHSIHQKQSCRRGNSRAVTQYIRNKVTVTYLKK